MCVIPKTCRSGCILGEDTRKSVKYIFTLQHLMVYYMCWTVIYTHRSLIYAKDSGEKPEKLRVNWVSHSGQGGQPGWLNPKPASLWYQTSLSFTKTSTLIGQTYLILYACSVHHQFWFLIKTLDTGDATAPSTVTAGLLLWLHQSNRKTSCCSQAEPEPADPAGINSPSLPLLKVG